jgi:hypothetical protein
MTDGLELVRRFRSEVPDPDVAAWADARTKLMRAIEAGKGTSEPVRRRRWWQSRRFLACGLAVLIGGGSAAAAVISSERAQPLSGRFPPASGGGQSIGGRHYSITVTPQLQAGSIGWCDSVVIGGHTGTACGGTPALGDPIAAGGSGGFSSEGYEYMLTTSRVAAVRIGSDHTFLTRRDPDAPVGLRAAVIVLPGHTWPQRPRTALDASGRPIAFQNESSALEPTLSWKSPAPPARGACSLRTPAHSGLTPMAGSVLQTVVPDPALVSPVFLSCINTAYALPAGSPGGKAVIVAALLLDARRPGTPVAPLPGMRRVAGHPEDLNTVSQQTATIPYTDGELGGLSARRAGNAWIVVAGARTLQQRLRLLNELGVGTIDLREPAAPPTAPAHAKCSITFNPLSALTEVSQTSHPATGIAVCAQASFYYHRRPMTADTVAIGPARAHSQNPGSSLPRAVGGHPYTFTARFDPARYPDLYTTWRQIGKTWIAVDGGTRTDQLELIDDITLHTKHQK